MKTRLILGVCFAFVFLTACEFDKTEAPTPSDALLSASKTSLAKKAPAIWSDCEMFATIGTNTSFKPTSGKFDILYTGSTFSGGLGSISDAKPGDKDYNGGRWHVYTLKAGVNTDYSNACSVEDLDLSDFEATTTYFECPLLPLRGNSSSN